MDVNAKLGEKKTTFKRTGYGFKENGPNSIRQTSLDKLGWEASFRADLLGRLSHLHRIPSESNNESTEKRPILGMSENLAAGYALMAEKPSDLLGTTAHGKTTGGRVRKGKKLWKSIIRRIFLISTQELRIYFWKIYY